MPQMNSSILCNDNDTPTCIRFMGNNQITDNKKTILKALSLNIFTQKG